MKKNEDKVKDFHAVEFMRKVRSELTELYLIDKPKYLEQLIEAMIEFKLRQKKAFNL